MSILKSCNGLLRSLLLLFIFAMAAQHSGAQQAQDYTRVTAVPRVEMDTWLKQEAAASGADWDNGRYAFYLGFATGHYGTDPVSAIAMRRAAFSLMNATLAAGDKLVPEAFEMKVSTVGDPVTLSADPESRAKFVNEVPYTSAPGSHGGHDIERALYETIQSIPASEAGSTVILLLNKDNASQAPTGEKASLFGADNSQLKQAIAKAGFRPTPVRKQFQMQSATGPVVVAVTALFPARMASLPGSFGARYPTFSRDSWQPLADAPAATEQVPNPAATAPHSTEQAAPPLAPQQVGPGKSMFPWWILPLLIIIVVVVLVVRAYGKRAGVQAVKTMATPGPKTAAPPASPAVPGVARFSVGPDEFAFPALTAASAWALFKDPGGKARLIDLSPPTDGSTQPALPGDAVVIARIQVAADKSLLAEAEGSYQFVEIQGTDADKCNGHKLSTSPGKRVLCRVQAADTGEKTRFEVVFEVQKGSRS